jgi:hypothetical protein
MLPPYKALLCSAPDQRVFGIGDTPAFKGASKQEFCAYLFEKTSPALQDTPGAWNCA